MPTPDVLTAEPNLLVALAAPDGQRWRSARPFVYLASLNVVAGGLVAAVSGPTGFELGSWTAAYLVLVGGVAQFGLGVAQAHLSTTPLDARRIRGEFLAWNLSTAAVIAGTLLSSPIVTSIGGVVLLATLVAFLVAVGAGAPALRWELLAYRGLIWFVLLSAPVGLALSWIRRG